jgi:PAS domain S-box-containing protein
MEANAVPGGWQALYSFVFAQSRSSMILLDSARRVVDVNTALLKLLAYDREDLIGRRIDGFLEPDEWLSLEADWSAFLRRGERVDEWTLVRADGRSVSLRYAVHWARIDGRGVALAIALDERVRARPVPLEELQDGQLTPRELDVVELVAIGLRAHEIAGRLAIAETTVRSHLRNAMRKSGARSQAQLVAIVAAGRHAIAA